MPRDYIPPRDADLLIWSSNFKTLIASGAVSYGLTAAQAKQWGWYINWIAIGE